VSEDEKLARLKRMRAVALAVLLVMLTAYAVRSLWQDFFQRSSGCGRSPIRRSRSNRELACGYRSLPTSAGDHRNVGHDLA
jgi:hypothetical protein